MPSRGLVQRQHDQLAPQIGQPVMQRAGGVTPGDGRGVHEQHVAGVEPGVHLHDGDAGLGVAGFDGAVDRRSAAPARQQRGVDVENNPWSAHPAPTAAGSGRRRPPPWRRHRRPGWPRAPAAASSGYLPSSRRLRGWTTARPWALRKLLHRRGLQLQAPAGRAVGLGQDQCNVKPGRKQALKGDARKFRGSGKNDFQGGSSLGPGDRQAWEGRLRNRRRLQGHRLSSRRAPRLRRALP
jgi:hypothetical protein